MTVDNDVGPPIATSNPVLKLNDIVFVFICSRYNSIEHATHHIVLVYMHIKSSVATAIVFCHDTVYVV